MKQRTRLIKLAATDPADGDTEWRDRLEQWFTATENHNPFNGLRINPDYYQAA